MQHLIEITERFAAMAETYKTRKQNAAERIVTLCNELQQATNAMNAAANADDMAAFHNAEARVHYLSARVEAAKREQAEPFFQSAEECHELYDEYRAAVNEAITPIYARFEATMDEQKALLEEISNIEARARVGFSGFSQHTFEEARRIVHPWSVSPAIAKYVDSDARDARKALASVLNK